MRDYTTNNYCDFLWINDLLELKKNGKNVFTTTLKKNNMSVNVSILNVIIFGTIIEVKEVRDRGFLYHVDDGTGVIVCKHTQGQFEEVIGLIESEQHDIWNESYQLRQNLEQSIVSEQSFDDSVFNDRSIQSDEADIIKKNQLMGLQSIWNDIYKSFSSLIIKYNLGDVVLIEGKLYNYFNVNQIYINNIRSMDFTEEIIKISLKLENGYEPIKKREENEKRLSGLITFDHIHHMNAKLLPTGGVESPKQQPQSSSTTMTEKVVTPNLQSTITFDTFQQETPSVVME